MPRRREVEREAQEAFDDIKAKTRSIVRLANEKGFDTVKTSHWEDGMVRVFSLENCQTMFRRRADESADFVRQALDHIRFSVACGEWTNADRLPTAASIRADMMSNNDRKDWEQRLKAVLNEIRPVQGCPWLNQALDLYKFIATAAFALDTGADDVGA
ncbi:uncharacterized protein JCM6883_002975 [Sporobolomyces salmoneus]|uniref:uncharacterized protein n=1 Tax=Sporobolomyces salmoneus TaxID=183962 RepID=UPI0031820D2B